MRNQLICLLIAGVTLVGCSKMKQKQPSPERHAPQTEAQNRLAMIEEMADAQPAFNKSQLEREFAEVEQHYPELAEYMVKREVSLVALSALAKPSCNTFREKYYISASATLFRRSVCPDEAIKPNDIAEKLLNDCEKQCFLRTGKCLQSPVPNDCTAFYQECLKACPATRSF